MSAALVLDLPRFAAPALCAETDPDAFNPEKGGSTRAAKRLCGVCPAREECLTYALDHRLISGWDGVWGGTSPRERARILRDRDQAPRRLTAVTEDVEVIGEGSPCHDLARPGPASGNTPELPSGPAPQPESRQSAAVVRRLPGATSPAVATRGWTDDELVAAVASCRAAGMTSREIADALGVTTSAVRRAA